MQSPKVIGFLVLEKKSFEEFLPHLSMAAIFIMWPEPFVWLLVPHPKEYVPCSLVVTCWERADILALLYVMFSCVFVTFPYGVLGLVWYLIVMIPGLCLFPYFLKFKFYWLKVSKKICCNILIGVQYEWPQMKGKIPTLIFGTYL